MTTLYLIRGVPGCGKSTLAQTLYDAALVSAVVEADQHFIDVDGNYVFDVSKLGEAHNRCKQRVELYLNRGFSVVVSNTSTAEKEVKTYQDIAEKYNAKFVSVVLENRHEGKNQHGVHDEKIQQMKNRFSIKL